MDLLTVDRCGVRASSEQAPFPGAPSTWRCCRLGLQCQQPITMSSSGWVLVELWRYGDMEAWRHAGACLALLGWQIRQQDVPHARISTLLSLPHPLHGGG